MMENNAAIRNGIEGTLFGQAIGDALGLGSEFMSKEDVTKNYPKGLTDYAQIVQDEHRCRWQRGDWTDDTDMMLCIANAIIEDKGVSLLSIAKNFKSWFNSSPLGIGGHTYNVLCFEDYEKDPIRAAEIIWKLYRKRSAANGGVMRTSVVGLLKDDVRRNAENVCKLTHPDPRCVGSCVIVSEIIHSIVYKNKNLGVDEILSIASEYDVNIESFVILAKNTEVVDDLGLTGLDMGYTLKTLAVGLWAYFHCSSFEEGLLKVVNAGGDADTNAAVACSILGAKFGVEGIPKKYINGLVRKEAMMKRANGIAEMDLKE